ncbi:glycosyltransferase family 2 protein [Chryseobacterium aquaticum]|uniref:Glycosyltransferase family 2 protein n=1 Tax=Chryseobacterium aquaticum TaxID=452084 RepID=A0A848N3U5_9FLAO|nr:MULTISPECIES: glycosyltransferase [Chryseobacterium]NMR33575.1 glycosyltransferase family 2 protein [Chryseobacterium aquaticum]NRQ45649.1 glycosyltransferase [Chryseobacterium sp. C-204]
MKLSVCIPVFNFDVRELVFELKREVKEQNINAEIILIDDASSHQFKTINNEILSQVNNFIFLEKNIGRSKIRNLFLEYVEGDYLLFLDCDGKIVNSDFLSIYIEYLKNNTKTDVLYGGRIVAKTLFNKKYILRWKFATERENLPVNKRREKPYLSFQTNNFIIKKEIFAKVQFDPEFENYGYEDLLFAMDLKSEHVTIDHIDNPIFNNDLENNEAYLKKVEESVESLAKMLKKHSLRPKISEIKLVSAYNFISKTYSNTFLLFLFSLIENTFKKNLLSDNPNLRNLDFYKLGLLFRKMK